MLASVVIAVILFVGLKYVVSGEYNLSLNMIIGNCLTIYFCGYIVALVNVVTIIKRLKAKIFWKTTLLGKLLKWCSSVVKKIKNQTYGRAGLIGKLVIFLIFCIIIMAICVALFGPIGVIIDLWIVIWGLYEIIKRLNCMKKIEKQLEMIYKGERVQELRKEDFTSEFYNVISYINDISNGFENAVEQGIKSERLKAELITNVSHDIKTPLTSIINYVDLLKNENIENEKAKEYIEVLDNKSQRLKKLILDLVEASKASSGNIELTLEKIGVLELIKQSIGEFEDKFEEKKLEIVKSIPEKEIYIKADSRHMFRIIENLFENITKYALENSRVYVDINQKENRVKIEIKNISKEKLNISEDELMQRFVRGDKSRSTEGNGLGLSISKSLAELQNGTFKIVIDGDLFKTELEFEIYK